VTDDFEQPCLHPKAWFTRATQAQTQTQGMETCSFGLCLRCSCEPGLKERALRMYKNKTHDLDSQQGLVLPNRITSIYSSIKQMK
jgi:hypothetical protein